MSLKKMDLFYLSNEEYKNIMDGVNIHPDGFRDYAPEEESDFDEPHSTEKMESVKEELLSENPAASAAAAMIMMQMQNPDTGKKIKAITPLKDKDHKLHNKAKGIFKRLKDKFSKKKEPRRGTVHNYLPKDYKRESVNEARSTNREWNKFEKAFGDFFTTVLRLGKANTKVTGDKTDEKIFIKNFNRDVGKFYSLMQSWVRGQNESVNEECCDNCKEGKTCCSVKKDIKEIINEAKFTDDTLVIRLKHWSKQHKGTGIGYGHVLGQLAIHMKEMGWNKSYKEVARIAVELGKKRKVESVNEAVPSYKFHSSHKTLKSAQNAASKAGEAVIKKIKGKFIVSVMESVNEGGMGMLDKDQTDVLHAIVMKNKNKNSKAILKIVIKDPMFKRVD